MDLAEQIRTDPEAGTRRLVAEWGPGLRAFALRLCGNRADADDLYMRTLETAVARIAGQKGPAFGGWLRAICLNLHRSDLRRERPDRSGLGDADEIPDGGPTPLEEAASRSEAELVRAALARLPDRDRLAILLRYWEGRSQQEVAAVIGTAEGTAKRILSRARATLRPLLEHLARRSEP